MRSAHKSCECFRFVQNIREDAWLPLRHNIPILLVDNYINILSSNNCYFSPQRISAPLTVTCYCNVLEMQMKFLLKVGQEDSSQWAITWHSLLLSSCHPLIIPVTFLTARILNIQILLTVTSLLPGNMRMFLQAQDQCQTITNQTSPTTILSNECNTGLGQPCWVFR